MADRAEHVTDQTPDPNISLAIRLEHRATQNAIVRSHRIMPSSRPDDDELDRAAATALREGVRRRTATFENTERDRLAWRDRAWKAESERDAALAEVERLIADGQQDAPIVDDATRQEVEALCASLLDAGSDERICNAVDRARELLAAAYLGRTD